MIQDIEPKIMFSSLLIVEPLINPAETSALEPLRKRLVMSASRRRDRWATRDEARLSLPGQRDKGKKEGRAKWDERVVRAFVVRPFCALSQAD